jgi:hypothetical protein
MPNCKFIWGSSSSHSLTLEVGRQGLQTNYKRNRSYNKAASGKIETIHLDTPQEMAIDLYITEEKYRDAVAWWSWVSQGKTFGFANSASNTGSTTLASAASASSTSVSVASDAGFVASDVVLFSTTSSSTVTLTAGLKYDYVAGSVFRHSDYWGSCVILDTTFAPKQTDAGFYNHNIKFTESL